MEGRGWFDDPELVQVRQQIRDEMSIALPKANHSAQTYLRYVSDSDAFLVGEDIKPRQWQVYYDIGLSARLGLYCYNFHKGTNHRFRFVKKCYTQERSLTKFFITLQAVNPEDRSPLTLETCIQLAGLTQFMKSWWQTCVCRLEGSEEADHEWNYEAINDHYRGEMPNWLSDDNQQQCYEVQESELLGMDYWWLHLFTEFAFYSKWSGTLRPSDIADSLPLMTQKMVVETRGEAATEAREMLKAPNAIFYISFSCGDDPATGELANYRAVVRKTMDGKPGHMHLEARCWTI